MTTTSTRSPRCWSRTTSRAPSTGWDRPDESHGVVAPYTGGDVLFGGALVRHVLAARYEQGARFLVQPASDPLPPGHETLFVVRADGRLVPVDETQTVIPEEGDLHRSARPRAGGGGVWSPRGRDRFRVSSRVMAASMSARWVKACGKLPSCRPVGPISSENRPRWLAYVIIFSNTSRACSSPPGPGQGVDVHERAQGEGALGAPQTVGRRLRVVAVDQAVGDQLPVHRVQRGRPHRVVGVMNPTVGMRSSEESSTSLP